ncbi:MAG: helix-turn-helix domain-containing protein [Oscillospiraceae bacterium]|nr:helix-turn-helix domain-containing protein [Oscillospiraceae bacterium]
MAVFRIEKTRDYTVMSNHHLRNEDLSLKAKGLLSLMLSLPDGWDYTTKGLAHICKDGVDSICAGVRELEEHGYVIRERVRNKNGQLGAIEYTILEQPRTIEPEREKPKQDNPILVFPALEKPEQEKPEQLNTKELSIYKSNNYLSNTEISNPIQSDHETNVSSSDFSEDGIGTDKMQAREVYRELILDNIDYDILKEDASVDKDRLDEIAELIVDTVCSARRTIRIAGDDFPAEVVKSRFLKLDSSHVQYVMDCMRDNTTYVRNIKKYLLAALYNAPSTINSYYSSLVQHDMYGDGRRGRE